MRIWKKWRVTRIAKWHKSPHNSTKAGWIGLKLYRIIEHDILSTFIRKNKIHHFDDFLFICSVRHNLSTHQKTPFPKYGHKCYNVGSCKQFQYDEKEEVFKAIL